ncbi:MAG TPA: carboxypeptidase-like regulatory domain-containing protein [Gemmatimonadaceae bacterium]|nr:carboxypeptidase-like regulatory domain-containing protein [Gemmatimonadaceae bacterium]
MKSFFTLVTSVLGVPALVVAQTATDVLAGRVTDLGGRPVADAQIEVVSLASRLARTQLTDSAGRYRIAFPEHAPRYRVTARRMGFAPVQRTIQRGSTRDEVFVADLQFTASPVALSMVEVTGDPFAVVEHKGKDETPGESAVLNPVAEMLARKEVLRLSAVQIVGLGEIADSLQARNSVLFRRVHTLIAKANENGASGEVTGTVAMMLREASANSDRAVQAAGKLLRPEQWSLISKQITAHLHDSRSPAH